MKKLPIFSALVAFASALYFIVPLYATFRFSLQMKRDSLSFDAYLWLFQSNEFLDVLRFSVIASICAILLGAFIVTPTAYWVRLKFPKLRTPFEFLSLLPLIIPSVVIVFGYIRLYGSGSILPFTSTVAGTNLLLVIGYAIMSLPYMYRAVDNGMAAIDINTLSEAAQSLGASRWTTIIRIIFPNVRAAIISGAFLTFSIALGEFVITSLLNRPGFGPYMVRMGQDYAYQPAAIAIMAFIFTWVCMAFMDYFASLKPGQGFFRRFGSKETDK